MKATCIALILLSQVHAQLPVAPGAELTLVSAGYEFTEGPASDADGNVYFTDQPSDCILKWSMETGKVTDFLQPAGRANGLYFDRENQLIACADEKGELRRIDPATKKITVLLSNYQDKLFNGPNDVWVDPKGGIYFTDPFYRRSYWKNRADPDQEKERVFFLPQGAKTPVIADDSLIQPNGIIGTADGKHLFVADIKAGKTYQYDISADGTLTNRRLFCELGSDGMTLDDAGNLYLTGNGVTVFDQTGKRLGNIPVPESWTSNATFGGKDRKTLFITAMDSLYTLQMTQRAGDVSFSR